MVRHVSGVFPPEPFHRIKIRSGAEEKLAKFRGICYNVFGKYCFAIFRGIRPAADISAPSTLTAS